MNAPSRKTPAPKGSEMIESTFVAAKDAMENVFGATIVTKNFESAVAFGRANVDAASEAGNALMVGAQEINQVWLALAQEAVNDGVAAMRRLTSCRSTPELIAAQSELTQASYEKFASKGRTLSALSAKLAEDVSAPVVARANAALNVLAKPIAA